MELSMIVDLILLAVNSHWHSHWQGLPELPSGLRWSLVLHTACPDPFAAGPLFSGNGLEMGPRSVAVFQAVSGRS